MTHYQIFLGCVDYSEMFKDVTKKTCSFRTRSQLWALQERPLRARKRPSLTTSSGWEGQPRHTHRQAAALFATITAVWETCPLLQSRCLRQGWFVQTPGHGRAALPRPPGTAEGAVRLGTAGWCHHTAPIPSPFPSECCEGHQALAPICRK